MANNKKTKKGLSFEGLDDLNLKKETNLEAAKQAVGITSKKTATPKKETAVPKQKAKIKEKEKNEELIRTTIDFPKSEHKKLKILAMEEDKKLYQYLYDIIKKHMDSKK